jgi:hypothetical protein
MSPAQHRPVRCWIWWHLAAVLFVERHKLEAFRVEVQFDFTGWAVTMLRQDKVGDILALGFGVVVCLAVNKGYDVGVLLDAS